MMTENVLHTHRVLERAAGLRATETEPDPLMPRLLRLPLFYKILIANVTILGLVVAAVLLVTHRIAGPVDAETMRVAALVAVAGVILSAAVNAAIVRLALQPLEELEDVASRVQQGETDARVERSALADRRLAHLSATFNAMLDAEATSRGRLREVNSRALTAAEEERKRIARELHDGTAQTLAALRVRLRIARNARNEDERTALIDAVSEEIAVAIEEVRRMARGLRPPALDVLGLAPAIETHARGVADAAGLQLQLSIRAVDGLLSPEAELAAYRVVQEALSNVVRHAHASRVSIELDRRGDQVHAVVQDNGEGFLVHELMSRPGRGLGLFGMQERAAYVGGLAAIQAQPGAGTRVAVSIPIRENGHHG